MSYLEDEGSKLQPRKCYGISIDGYMKYVYQQFVRKI
jgi:hypothetical protein